MWNTIKRLFAGDAAQNSTNPAAQAGDLTQISTPELETMNQDLGRAQDAIREKRLAINNELRMRRDGPPASSDVTVQGQTLVARARV